jgi:hypothetical protein
VERMDDVKDAMSGAKVLILDPEMQRAERVAFQLRREGYEPLLFDDPRVAFAYAYRSRTELAAAVVESDGGRERRFVQSLRLLRPDLQIFAGIGGSASPRRHRRGDLTECAEARA